eukprot:scaffold6092_cov359-Prasinococcus_capsulatus_cf.AAC.3
MRLPVLFINPAEYKLRAVLHTVASQERLVGQRPKSPIGTLAASQTCRATPAVLMCPRASVLGCAAAPPGALLQGRPERSDLHPLE